MFPDRDHGREAAADSATAVPFVDPRETRAAELLHPEFDRLASRIPRDGSAGQDEAEKLCELIATLATLYRPHVRAGNELEYPAASRLLTAEDVRQLGAEMQARRGPRAQRYW